MRHFEIQSRIVAIREEVSGVEKGFVGKFNSGIKEILANTKNRKIGSYISAIIQINTQDYQSNYKKADLIRKGDFLNVPFQYL